MFELAILGLIAFGLYKASTSKSGLFAPKQLPVGSPPDPNVAAALDAQFVAALDAAIAASKGADGIGNSRESIIAQFKKGVPIVLAKGLGEVSAVSYFDMLFDPTAKPIPDEARVAWAKVGKIIRDKIELVTGQGKVADEIIATGVELHDGIVGKTFTPGDVNALMNHMTARIAYIDWAARATVTAILADPAVPPMGLIQDDESPEFEYSMRPDYYAKTTNGQDVIVRLIRQVEEIPASNGAPAGTMFVAQIIPKAGDVRSIYPTDRVYAVGPASVFRDVLSHAAPILGSSGIDEEIVFS